MEAMSRFISLSSKFGQTIVHMLSLCVCVCVCVCVCGYRGRVSVDGKCVS